MSKDELVFQGKHFRVYHEKVEPESGASSIYEYVWRVDGTRTVALCDGEVLLTREYRHELDEYDWRLPGGKLDPGEDHREGAEREFREETGYSASRWEYMWSSTPDATVRYQRHFFLAEDLAAGEAEPELGEDITVHWVSLDHACRLALEGAIREEISALAILRIRHRLRPAG